jgi:N-carbamoylputrescine amidase
MTRNLPGGPVRTGMVQMRCVEDPDDNLARALAMTEEAISQGAEIVCLPELFRSRYFCQVEDAAYFELAEPVPGPSTEAFERLATKSGATLIVSLFERRTAGLYHNTLAVIDGERGYVGKYRKMHIPDDPGFYEKFYFTPGDLGFRVFPGPRARIGTLICWDQWYPEAARLTALKGAEMLFYPTAIGWHPSEKEALGDAQHQAWETIQRSHAVANGCFVIAVNRTGFEPHPSGESGIEFWGQSFIAAPDGRIICRAPVDEESVVVAELDLGEIASARHGWPFLRDRRIDAYGQITARYLEIED